MRKIRSAVTAAAAILLLRGAAAQSAPAPEKTVGEVMKNVRVLKDVPESEWNDTMIFISSSLGVSCRHCHATEGFESDDLKPKQTARAMIQMMRELNRINFAGRTAVTCYTCHQGSLRPKTALTLSSNAPAPPAPAPAAKTDALPGADQVLASYRQAVGGGEIKSLRLKGVIVPGVRPPLEAEIDLFPDRFVAQISVPGGPIRQIRDRDRGWVVAPGRTIEMTSQNLVSSRHTEEILSALKFVHAEGPRKTTGTETIGDRSYTLVESRTGRRLERLYFDTRTALLFRRYTEAQTVLGLACSETTFEDYRDVNGMKLAFLITEISSQDRVQYKFSSIEANIPFDRARFELPHF